MREVLSSEKDKAIAEIIIRLGSTLAIEVVAEGVENESQYRFLSDSGCRFFQGHYFGTPDTSDAFEASVRRQPSVVRPNPVDP